MGILRVLKAQPELVIVVDGLVKSGRPLYWIIITLIVITYIFAVFFVVSVKHDIFADSDVDPNATLCEKDEFFCDLARAMQTLLDIIVGAEWSNVSHPITQHQPWLLLPLNTFLVVTVFGIANVIVGVIVDATAETKIRLKFKENREKLIQVSKMWEKEIVQADLRLETLDGLEGDALEAKRKQRQEKTEKIVKRIIDSKIIDFPAAARPNVILSLLSRKPNGEVNHEDFTVSMGRLLMADERKLMFQLLINHAIGMDAVREVMEKAKQMDDKLDILLSGKQRSAWQPFKSSLSKLDCSLHFFFACVEVKGIVAQQYCMHCHTHNVAAATKKCCSEAWGWKPLLVSSVICRQTNHPQFNGI